MDTPLILRYDTRVASCIHIFSHYFCRGIRYIDLREPATYVEMERETGSVPNEMTSMNDVNGNQHHGAIQANREPAANGNVPGSGSEGRNQSRTVNSPVDV